MPTRISVVIPAYNATRFLEQCLASVRAQRALVSEMIVVDDCSADGTADLARSLGATVLSTGRNAGPSAARNIGWRAASGELIAFLDADDYWAPDHCEVLADLLDRFPDVELAFSQTRTFGGSSGVTRPVLPDGVPTAVAVALSRANLLTQSAAMVRRRALQAVGGYDERFRYSEDYDLWLRLAARAPFVCSHRVTSLHRVHDGQATMSEINLVRGCWAVRTEFLQRARRTYDAATVGAVEANLRIAYETDLTYAWDIGNRDLLMETLALHRIVPGSRPIHAAWERRRRMLWYPWRVARYAFGRTPRFVVRPIRAIRSRLKSASRAAYANTEWRRRTG